LIFKGAKFDASELVRHEVAEGVVSDGQHQETIHITE